MKKYVDLIREIGKLKNVKRAGWVREGIKDPESVADHTFRTAVIAMVIGKNLGIDVDKLIKMALLHDLGEGSIGDRVAERGTKIDMGIRNEKNQQEIEAIKKMFGGIDSDESLSALQKEALEMNTREGQILKQIERLEMAIQALEYEEKYGLDLTEFFENSAMHITDSYLKEILRTVIGLRPKKI